MRLKNKRDISKLIEEDQWMMDILKAAKTLQLPDWWICAGFVRSKIWDTIHGIEERTSLDDIDVVYFDRNRINKDIEKKYEKVLKQIMPEIPWSVKNEARMHLLNNLHPYVSSVDAISKFPETATALGVKLSESNEVILTAPCGIEDVLNGIIRPSPYFLEANGSIEVFKTRLHKKNWPKTWNQLQMVEK